MPASFPQSVNAFSESLNSSSLRMTGGWTNPAKRVKKSIFRFFWSAAAAQFRGKAERPTTAAPVVKSRSRRFMECPFSLWDRCKFALELHIIPMKRKGCNGRSI